MTQLDLCMQTALWLQCRKQTAGQAGVEKGRDDSGLDRTSKHGRREAETPALGFVEFRSLIISILLGNVAQEKCYAQVGVRS